MRKRVSQRQQPHWLYGLVGKSVALSYSCCAGGRRFEFRLWYYSSRSFHPTRQLARFSPSNMPSVVNSNLFRISPSGEAVNYKSYASPSFEVAKPRKITAFFGHYYQLINQSKYLFQTEYRIIIIPNTSHGNPLMAVLLFIYDDDIIQIIFPENKLNGKNLQESA